MYFGKKLPISSRRLKELREQCELSQQQMTETLKCGDKSYRNWEVYGKTISTYWLEKLADFFHVSTDYILGRSDVLHIGNEEIQAATGLSEKSIEVLRHLSSERPSEWNDVATDNYLTIDSLNYLLESCYEEMLERRISGFHVNTIFRDIALYIFPDIVEDNEESIDSNTSIHTKGTSYVFAKKELFAEYALHTITKRLDYYRDKNKV